MSDRMITIPREEYTALQLQVAEQDVTIALLTTMKDFLQHEVTRQGAENTRLKIDFLDVRA